MKRILSLALCVALLLSCTVFISHAASEEAINSAWALYERGLFSGVGTNPDGTPNFDLDRVPTREECIAMLVKLLGKEEEAMNGTWTTPFTDVHDWAKNYVGYAYANKLTSGTSPTTFGASDAVTTAQYVSFVLITLGYEIGKDFQWDKPLQFSDQIGLTHGEYSSPSAPFTRGDVAIISYRSLVMREAEPILVSEPVEGNPLEIQVNPDSVYIQDLYEYMGTAMTVKLPDDDDWEDELVYYSFNGSSDNADDIEAFINTICNGSYNLALTDKTVIDGKTTFVSYAIDYTGTGRVKTTQESNFSRVKCNVSLYYSVERGKLKGALIIPSSMKVVDLGLRCDGGNQSPELAGPSAKAGLYLLPDGSFQTTDGRLSVQPGKATVLRDGKQYTTDATFEREDTEDHMWAMNFYRDETIFFSTPVSRLETGDIFTMRDLLYNSTPTFDNAKDFANFRHDDPFLGIGHNGQFITPRTKGRNQFEEVTVRILYWEPDVVGVYYVYAKLDSAPYEIECLIAPSLQKTEGFSGGENEYQLSVGQSVELSPSRKFHPNYELFTWEIVDGAGVVELANTTSSACTVTAKREGTAVVRVRYNYGIDEPDVLTGYMHNEDHTVITEYTIFVE